MKTITTLQTKISPQTSPLPSSQDRFQSTDIKENTPDDDSSEASFNTIDENISSSEFAEPLNELVLKNQPSLHPLL